MLPANDGRVGEATYQIHQGTGTGTGAHTEERYHPLISTPITMRQKAPYPEVLRDLVERVRYRPGWTLSLVELDRGQGSAGLTLVIGVSGVDSADGVTPVRVNHFMIVPAASYDERSWRRWIFTQLLLVEQHEAMEFFRIDGVRPYAPGHQPGSDPYTVYEPGSALDRTVNYRGEAVDER